MDEEAPIPSLPILSEEETLKQLQDDFTKQYRQRISELESQNQQLREEVEFQKKTTIERCKTIGEHLRTIEELQTTILGLREAIQKNHKWHQDYDEHDGYPDSDLCEVNCKALSAFPADFRKDWVKREVLEKITNALAGHFGALGIKRYPVLSEALTIAQKELDAHR